MASFTPLPLYPWMAEYLSMIQRKKCNLPLPGTETQLLHHPSSSIVTIMTELSKLYKEICTVLTWTIVCLEFESANNALFQHLYGLAEENHGWDGMQWQAWLPGCISSGNISISWITFFVLHEVKFVLMQDMQNVRKTDYGNRHYFNWHLISTQNTIEPWKEMRRVNRNY
jgi:hypothetical protein